MSSNDATMETALLEIAKDLLQASDDLASTDPSASAKLAHEAYEIGRDLGIVRNHLDDDDEAIVETFETPSAVETPARADETPLPRILRDDHVGAPVEETLTRRRNVEDDSDDELFRILDRQKAMLPKPVEMTPARTPSRGTRSLTFESAPTRRSGWFGWMRPREWRHAG